MQQVVVDLDPERDLGSYSKTLKSLITVFDGELRELDPNTDQYG
jgi:hypothetical protein